MKFLFNSNVFARLLNVVLEYFDVKSSAMLEVQHCDYAYTPETQVLNDINLSIQSGEFFGLLGENGAGKTTLIQLITSMLRLQSGDVMVDGRSLHQDPVCAKRKMGWVPQEFNFNGFQTLEYMLLNNAGYFGMRRSVARSRMQYLLTTLDLWDRRGMKIHQLSGGLKRRLMIVRALMHEPSILLLDEPTVGIDVGMREETWTFLEQLNQQEGVTIVLTSHYLEEIERLCQTVGLLHKGVLIQSGQLSDLFQGLARELMQLQLTAALPQNLTLPGQHAYDAQTHVLTIITDEQTQIDQVILQLHQHQIGVKRVWAETTRLAHLMKQWTHVS
jgi:ABC-2 type transport system ATP-binding protein